MKIKTPFLAATALSCGLFLCAPETAAQSYFENYVNDNQGQALHRQSKSAKQRVAAGKSDAATRLQMSDRTILILKTG